MQGRVAHAVLRMKSSVDRSADSGPGSSAETDSRGTREPDAARRNCRSSRLHMSREGALISPTCLAFFSQWQRTAPKAGHDICFGNGVRPGACLPMTAPPLRQHAAAMSAVLALGVIAASQGAKAYSGDSVVSDGCHERITMDALRRWRSQLPAIEIPAADSNERALIADVPFGLDADLRDLAAVTTLLANRDVDLKGHEADDLKELAPIHGDPRTQEEHCLR